VLNWLDLMNDIERLYQEHAYESVAVDDWIEMHFGDVDAVRAFGPIAEMRGQFTHSESSHIYQYQFTPKKDGTYRAIVMPVLEDGVMVDLVTWRWSQHAKRLDVWGCVTHAGRFLNRDAIYKPHAEPLHICERWFQFIARDCNAVLPLRVSAIPELVHAGDVAVSNSSHALQLLHEAYLWPLKGDPRGPIWKEARERGRRHIYVDDGGPVQ
jgi:hypothetical protein